MLNIKSHTQTHNETRRHIYTVLELTTGIKVFLEDKFPMVWVCGEISNFKIPVSGHYYFTLKDQHAQVNCVMFRGQNRNLKFKPEDGMGITGLGRISVYEPRGTYQIIFEYMEPEGTGAIQLAFEQLKARLSDEGLFNEKYKRPLPFLPKNISILTSPTGSVVHDILKIINRRFPNVRIQIIPVKVQGDSAVEEIVSGIGILNKRADADVAILARGGGSIEDLQAFNSEEVARAIFASTIPVISAVGHETDFTISDFVADLRAPTPSAAAELIVPLKRDLLRRSNELYQGLIFKFFKYVEKHVDTIKELANRLVDPNKKIEDLRLRTDDLNNRLIRIFLKAISFRRERLIWRVERLGASNPVHLLNKYKEQLDIICDNLLTYMRILISIKRSRLRELAGKLHALSPVEILGRGYSIIRTIPDAVIIRNSTDVSIGRELEVLLARGTLICTVKRKQDYGETDV